MPGTEPDTTGTGGATRTLDSPVVAPAGSGVTRRPDSFAGLREETRAVIGNWRALHGGRAVNDSWARGVDVEFSRELGRHRLLGVSWPAAVGGRGLSYLARLAVTEELLRAGAPVAAHWLGDRQVGPAIIRTGTQRLQDELLPGLLTADVLFCVGLSEPDAGSDLASVRTRAVRADGGWLISGSKIWTSNAHLATHGYVLARSDPHAPGKHAGLSEFIVSMDDPGITVSPIVDMAGQHHFNEVHFDQVFVPDYRVLGEVGQGWRQAVAQLSFERGGPERFLSTYPLFTELLARCGQADESLLVEVGYLTARLAMLRQLVRDVVRSMDEDRPPVTEAATLKYLGSQFELDVIDVARRAGLDRLAGDAAGFFQALVASPTFTLRGGAREVLLSMIVKAEVRA